MSRKNTFFGQEKFKHVFFSFTGTPRPQPNQQPFMPPAAPQQQRQQLFSQLSPRQPDPYAQAPGTPRPVDPYAQPPGTPRPSAEDSGFHMPQPQPEVNRQLRDLLQRQQFKKLEQEQLVPGQSTRIWPQEDRTDNQQQGMFEGQQNQQQQAVTGGDNTFRHPLPPGMRPRVPLSPGMLIRGPGGVSSKKG